MKNTNDSSCQTVIKCPYRFGMEYEHCIEEECEAYTYIMRMKSANLREIFFAKQNWVKVPWCGSFKKPVYHSSHTTITEETE